MTAQSETIDYRCGDAVLRGCLSADPNASAPRPGVLVVHEWWGCNDYIRGRAEQLANCGYTALAVDMYGDGQTAQTPEAAGKLMNAVLGDMETGQARLRAAFDVLAARDDTDAARIAAIGYCFGGAVALHAARVGLELAAAVSFHGALASFHTPAPGGVKARVLVCHGGADSLVPGADVDAFKAEMDAAGADYRFVDYAGAQHGFTNPAATENGRKFNLPLAYDADADRQSWRDMAALLEEVFDK
ncbi:MAG: dienelactone hydrolase family protein [Gammaproteobacteria bacterium]|nr:dienelactone hydrolase family protein [Gammaproteobacteria bacterium]